MFQRPGHHGTVCGVQGQSFLEGRGPLIWASTPGAPENTDCRAPPSVWVLDGPRVRVSNKASGVRMLLRSGPGLPCAVPAWIRGRSRAKAHHGRRWSPASQAPLCPSRRTCTFSEHLLPARLCSASPEQRLRQGTDLSLVRALTPNDLHRVTAACPPASTPSFRSWVFSARDWPTFSVKSQIGPF